ncbi:hypothetical protein CKO12_12975 [Chromatium okenii]|uniref:O-linked N-acetylglucosamine transferase, SPINDLY family protein n=1 Tax=Chromatium okenii TaxID=61644 RepID=UPI0019084AE8|nr:tetratricopeptide repeat protein [Chromatium okenii]MBK1642765.1 hypothetical protein [Chromatium okenii]
MGVSSFDTLLELLRQGQFTQAEYLARQITQHDPKNSFAWKTLGTLIMRDPERIQAALPLLEHARQLAPADVDILNSLGHAYCELNHLDESYNFYMQAVALQPDSAEIWNNKGLVEEKRKQWEAALESYQRAVALKPHYVKALNNCGNALQALNQIEAALSYYAQVLALDAHFPDAHYNCGCLLQRLKSWKTAQVFFERTITLKHDHVGALNNVGLLLIAQGLLDEALARFARVIQLNPNMESAHSNTLFTLNYHPNQSAEAIFAAYSAFNQCFGAPQRAKWRPHLNHNDPERRLHIGYVSPDFCAHSVRFFLEPLLAHHDKAVVEITAYSQTSRQDAMTARYQSYVEHWVDTESYNDDELAAKIRADGIDILVELAGHSAGNRLLMFTHRPAPVSISWLGYAYTTGLTAIDYFLTDAVMVPAGSETLFAEQPWRVAVPSMVYRPDGGIGEVNSLPALERGFITFGTLTRGIRINHRVIRVWSNILQRLPHSRLVVNSDAFNSLERQQALVDRFAIYGIAPEQLVIGFNSPPYDVLRGVDIALDCFPHNSGTTLIESLYLGLPFVTLADRPSVGRIGSMILHGAGHPEWIAHTEEEYIEKTVALASDLPRLAAIRANLRDELEASPWRDEVGFTRRIEQAYRDMWRRWCATTLRN